MYRKILILSILFIISAPAIASEDSQQSHPFSVHDMLAMDRISEPKISPNGRWIVFVLRKTDLEADKGRTDLWLIGTNGTGLLQLTTNSEADSNPCWAPDSKSVYFISTRSGSSQVWQIQIDGGEARQITDEPLDAGNLIISPDGKYIAFTMEMFPDCNTPAETKNKLDEIENRKASGRIYEKLFVRHWDTWKADAHIFLWLPPPEAGR